MTQKYPKRLIEVDLPIRRISAHARREKSIRHGHISTLHIWWARRPLAACRAVICASLWPDPADPLCPQDFRDKASEIISNFARAAVNQKELGENCDHDTWIKWQALAKKGGLDSQNELHWKILRFALLDFIADFANWDNSTSSDYLRVSRNLTVAAHEALGGPVGTRPLVVDPFAGGGSIPIEALRVGADVFASDLNPLPVMLNKVAIEYIPKYGQKLADQVRKWGRWIKQEAEKELAEFYPKDPDGGTPIAYLWARTVRCEGPDCGAKIPLIRSLWLGKKPHNASAMVIECDPKNKTIQVGVRKIQKNEKVGVGTVRRGSATCPLCGYTTPAPGVKGQLTKRRGGTEDAQMNVVVSIHPDKKGRFYRTATDSDRASAKKAAKALEGKAQSSQAGLFGDLNEPTPKGGGSGAGRAFSQQAYGMTTFGSFFLKRQTLALCTLADLVTRAGRLCALECDRGFAQAVQELLAMNVSKLADYNSALATWLPQASQETVAHTFARPAISMVWDFAEAYPLADSSGGWLHSLEYMISPLEAEGTAGHHSGGHAASASATRSDLPDASVAAFITDPPYYDAVPYADLSDFFIVWLKRALRGTAFPEVFGELSPKNEECVLDEVKGHDADFFHKTMHSALAEGRRICRPDGIAVIVFAHKTTGAWETLLQSMIDAGWIIIGSWPIDTERANRLRAMDSAALASSVHLVCRPRGISEETSTANKIGDWRDILQELPCRIHEWMPRLADEGVVGADAIFACLGPGLEVFSRYSRVEKANGEAVALREYLEHVWAAVAKEALALVFAGADATGFEPDARLTAMWLWTLKTPDSNDHVEDGDSDEDSDDEQGSKKAKITGFKLEYDAARKIAQGLGAHLESLTHLVEVSGDQARLLPVTERTKHLFGRDEEEPARAAGRKKASAQLNMFAELTEADNADVAWKEKTVKRLGDTSLDRIHQAMILFAAGRSEALMHFVVEDGAGQDGKFWRLAQALSALYPSGTDEKRWVDGVLARKKQFGF